MVCTCLPAVQRHSHSAGGGVELDGGNIFVADTHDWIGLAGGVSVD